MKQRTIALAGPCDVTEVLDLLEGATHSQPGAVTVSGPMVISNLARALIHRGFKVSIVSHNFTDVEQARLGEHLSYRQVRARPRPRAHSLDLCRVERRRLAAAIQETHAEVVHAHWTYEYGLAAIASGMPCIVTAHDDPWAVAALASKQRNPRQSAYWLARALQSELFRHRAAKVALTAVSDHLADAWARHMRWRGPIAVVPNAIPEGWLVSRRPNSHPSLLCIAGAGPIKNVWKLIRAFAEVEHGGSGIRLKLIGPGLGPTEPLAQRAWAHGLDQGVEFLGVASRTEIQRALSEAWCLVHPSVEESFGMVVLEAMASGVPVIAGRDSGALPWLLDYGKAGLLTDVTSVSHLATSINTMLGNPQLRTSFASEAEARVKKHFQMKTVIEAYEHLYEEVLSSSQ